MSGSASVWHQMILPRVLSIRWRCILFSRAAKKVPTISKLESDTAARHALLLKSWQKQCQEKKAQAKGWRLWLEEEMG